MSGYKDYRSVTEFPLHVQKLSREELESHYQDIRNEYKSLTISRGQLVRRQQESKTKLVDLKQNLQDVTGILERVNQEKDRLQQSLAHSVQTQENLRVKRDVLSLEIEELTAKMSVTHKLIADFEAVYEDVKEASGPLSWIERFTRLLQAAQRLLSTDLNELMPKPAISDNLKQDEDWKNETWRNVNPFNPDNK